MLSASAPVVEQLLRDATQVFFEGQEEIGSPQLPAILKKHAKLLASDFVVSADGSQVAPDQGSLTIGLRGATAFEVEATVLATDVHSGALPLLQQCVAFASNAVGAEGDQAA